MELLLLIGLLMLGVFVVGAVMLHILVGLILWPVSVVLAVCKGLFLTVFAIPLAAVGLSIAFIVISLTFVLGVIGMVFACVF